MDKSFVNRITEITEANMSNCHFGVEELAREMGMSTTSLYRKMHALTSKSPIHFIKEIRLRKAMELMKQEGMTAAEVSYQTGFSSPAYFTNCFHNFYGYPPGEVKKMMFKIPEENGSAESSEISNATLVSVKHEGQKPLRKKLNGQILFAAAAGCLVVLVFLVFEIIPGHGNQEKSIAVLPFKSLSDDPQEQYLADGMQDEILLRLFEIRDRNLRVLSRTSVEQYRVTNKTIQTIAKELNVKYILESTFQKYKDSLRLIVQLIRANKQESHIWANKYEEKWKDIFSVSSEVAQAIASEIKVAVSPQEKKIIESPPTSDLKAYDYYRRGRDYVNRSSMEKDIRFAIRMYEKAIEIDPDYALALAGLAGSSRDLFWQYYDRSEANLSKVKQYLDKALALSPGLKEVRIVEASYYYQCKQDYHKSLELLERLKTEYPNDEDIFAWIGFVYRRMGDFRKALDYGNRAISLNPSAWGSWFNAAITLEANREYTKAEKNFKKTIDLNPSISRPYDNLLQLYINTGRLQKAKAFLTVHEQYIESQDLKLIKARLEFLARNYDEAIQITQSLSEEAFCWQSEYFTKNLQLGLLYRTILDKTLSIRYFELERDLLMKNIKGSENDDRLYSSLGIAYAGLGMKEQALEAGRKALKILDSSKDALGGYLREMDMARILLMVGQYDDALKKLEQVIKHNGFWSVEILKLDPFWDPVRNIEKFKEIISNPEYQVNFPDN